MQIASRKNGRCIRKTAPRKFFSKSPKCVEIPGCKSLNALGLSGSFTGRCIRAICFAKQNVAANINATKAANVTAVQWVGGDVTAGTDAVVTANGDIVGVVDAGDNTDVFAMGNITNGTVSAGTGDVDAMAFGDITSLLIAGADVDGFAMSDMTIGQVTAGGNADLFAMGASANLMLLDAGGDVNITSFGTLIAPAVTAGGDADLFAMGLTVVDITASTNASVFSNDDVDADIVATEDASLTALGGILETVINAGGDALAYAGGAITDALINAGGSGSMTALAQIADSSVYGDEGAFAMAGSDMTLVTLVSANGEAGAISAGNIASATLNAGTDASLVAVGEVSLSNIAAGGELLALAQGDMTGTSADAGTDAFMASYGELQLDSVNAGGDVSLMSVGNLTADVDAGGTLEASTYEEIDGTYEADDDIIGIAARGPIKGTYLSRDNVDAVFSLTGIDADITADGTGDPTDADGDGRGRIGEIVTWGNFEGTATTDSDPENGEVEKVVVGGTVGATMHTPTTGEVIENDRTYFTAWHEPRPAETRELTSELVNIGEALQSLSELLGISRDALDEGLDAVQNVLNTGWDQFGEELGQMLVDGSAWIVNQSGQLLDLVLQADNEADRTCSGISNDFDQAAEKWERWEQTNRLKADFDLAVAQIQLDGMLQKVWAQIVQRQSGASQVVSSVGIMNGQVNDSGNASSGQADVVADATDPSGLEEDWCFTRDDYAALLKKGGELTFGKDSAWFPKTLQENLKTTLDFVLTSENPVRTTGISIEDFFHGHILMSKIGSEELTTLRQKIRDYRKESSAIRAEALGGDRFADITEENLDAYIQGVKNAEKLARPLIDEALKVPGGAVLYHTFEYNLPEGMKPGSPVRCILTPIGEEPRGYDPSGTENGFKFFDYYRQVVVFTFLVDQNGVIHVTLGLTRDLSKATGEIVRGWLD